MLIIEKITTFVSFFFSYVTKALEIGYIVILKHNS
jgi:hypothetical protein